jgi:hypothetical protein
MGYTPVSWISDAIFSSAPRRRVISTRLFCLDSQTQ